MKRFRHYPVNLKPAMWFLGTVYLPENAHGASGHSEAWLNEKWKDGRPNITVCISLGTKDIVSNGIIRIRLSRLQKIYRSHCMKQVIVSNIKCESLNNQSTWSFMGSYKWGYK